MANRNGIKVNNARLPDVQSLIQAGIDPKTGLPVKFCSSVDSMLKENIKKNLRILDEECALSRYTWYNLPDGLTTELVERILYYRGQFMFFYLKETDKFYALPFTLDGTIDVYGRYTGITPLPFNGSVSGDGKKDKPWIQGLIRTPKYDILDEDDLAEAGEDVLLNSAVICKDYCEQISQTVLSRQILNEPILELEAEMLPFLRTALLNSTGVAGLRVSSEDELNDVLEASRSIDKAALNGEKFVPIIGQLDFQSLTDGSTSDPDKFLMALQSIDNFRLGLYGLENGGVFNKNTYQSTGEVNMNMGVNNIPLTLGLKYRQRFCDIVNSIWGLGISCELSEVASQIDKNLDGLADDAQDQSGTEEGEQPEGAVNDEP